MSINFNVTEQDVINSRKLSEQQKNQRAFNQKIKNRILKQTQDIKIAESLSLITKRIDTINDSTKNLGEVIKESNSEDNNIRALPNSSKFSKSLREMLGSLMNSRNCLKFRQDGSGRGIILGVPIQISGADRIKMDESIMIKHQIIQSFIINILQW